MLDLEGLADATCGPLVALEADAVRQRAADHEVVVGFVDLDLLRVQSQHLSEVVHRVEGHEVDVLTHQTWRANAACLPAQTVQTDESYLMVCI